MRKTIQKLKAIFQTFKKPVLAFSGGRDSSALLHLIVSLGLKPDVVFVDTQMDSPETRPFVEYICQNYGLTLHITQASKTPAEIWEKHGYPFLGKIPAVLWNRKHKAFGYKLNSCCTQIKLHPGRAYTRAIGADVQITGIKLSDDYTRKLKMDTGGLFTHDKAHKLNMAHPISHWTETMKDRYIRQNNVELHPIAMRRENKRTTCIYCCCGMRYSDHGLRQLRMDYPAEWEAFVVDMGVGHIILSLKYDKNLDKTKAAVSQLGGLAELARTRPHIFDYINVYPKKGTWVK